MTSRTETARAKTALRAAMTERRAAAAGAEPGAGHRLATLFPENLVPAPGAVISGYVRFRSEIDPAPVMARLAGVGASLALPRVPPRRAAGGLIFHRWASGAPLVRSAFGVMEPAAEAPVVEPDIILVPLLAFDRGGRRLGYGAGHYDRTLARLRALKPIRAIGLAFTEQELPEIPVDETDERLDGVLTPDGFIPTP